jgi:hypothetical protein
MRLLHSILIVALLIPLGACSNRVVSQAPWFRPEATATSPKLREGVWRFEDPRCKTRETEPAERWPTCASWSYLRGNQGLSPQWIEEGTGRHRRRTYNAWSATETVIVAGDPLISQSADCPQMPKAAAADGTITAEPGAAPPPAPPSDPPVSAAPPRATFCYDAVRATAFDAEGRITALETWPVLCGPWPREGGNVTDRPWPGLSLVGDNCTATSEAALREAARRSRDVALGLQFVARLHWVRDGYH